MWGRTLTHTYLIVTCELPETRDTLLVRLMGATGHTLQRAIAELKALSRGRVPALTIPVMMRLRTAIPSNRGQRTEDDQEFLMVTQEILEDLFVEQRQKEFEIGSQEMASDALLKVYKARFGQPPRDIVAAIERTSDLPVLRGWLDLFAIRSADDIAAALRNPRPR